jgi:hypothetical protein
MEKLKIAILGVGSIGEFHSREFNDLRCEVVAILTSKIESAYNKAKKLKEKYNINARSYSNLNELLSKEKIDAVSICTPHQFHSEQVRKCLEHNLHVLCEKPFVLDNNCDNYKIAKNLFELAKEKGKVLSVNTQLISMLDYIPKRIYSEGLNEFSMYMEPNKKGVINLITEVTPHMNSFLIRLMGNMDIKNIKFPIAQEDNVKINFNYGTCRVEYNIKIKDERPRKVEFSINGNKFERKIKENYEQELASEKNSVKIKDPLNVSIQKFIEAVKNKGKPLVGESEILQNVKLQDLIIKEYLLTI